MATEVLWQPSVAASGLHAIEGVGRSLPVADPRIADLLAAISTRLRGDIAAARLPSGPFWRNLLGLAPSNAGIRQMVATALTKSVGRQESSSVALERLAATLTELQTGFRAALPNLADELALRERPLREQWEARGSGLLAQIGRLTDEQLLPEKAMVILVHPTFGGAGEAHLAFNSVRIEAVLANPHADLPEIVRLAWLIAQLQLDLPTFSENIHADRLPHLARFAMLPAVLTAAEEVELARWSPDLVRRAISAWHLPAPADVDAAQIVLDWWETYQQSRPPFAVALAALDQMFG